MEFQYCVISGFWFTINSALCKQLGSYGSATCPEGHSKPYLCVLFTQWNGYIPAALIDSRSPRLRRRHMKHEAKSWIKSLGISPSFLFQFSDVNENISGYQKKKSPASYVFVLRQLLQDVCAFRKQPSKNAKGPLARKIYPTACIPAFCTAAQCLWISCPKRTMDPIIPHCMRVWKLITRWNSNSSGAWFYSCRHRAEWNRGDRPLRILNYSFIWYFLHEYSANPRLRSHSPLNAGWKSCHINELWLANRLSYRIWFILLWYDPLETLTIVCIFFHSSIEQTLSDSCVSKCVSIDEKSSVMKWPLFNIQRAKPCLSQNRVRSLFFAFGDYPTYPCIFLTAGFPLVIRFRMYMNPARLVQIWIERFGSSNQCKRIYSEFFFTWTEGLTAFV